MVLFVFDCGGGEERKNDEARQKGWSEGVEDIFVWTNSKSEGRKEGKNTREEEKYEEAKKPKSQSNNPHK